MATIITVHGTKALSREERSNLWQRWWQKTYDIEHDVVAVEEGPNWWQRTSDFERDVHEFVGADDQKINIKPFIWNGLNSETSRRKAGARLLQELQLLEMQENKYCLVGHSHGGSVIGRASSRVRRAMTN